ncbi:MAG TPA: S8/S53 family peptidase [Polyangia bacterium]
MFCRYDVVEGANHNIKRLRDALREPGWTVASDCPVVTPFSIEAALMKTTLTQNGATRVPKQADPPTIAVVDTAAHPYLPFGRDTFGHGRAVGRLIAELACPDPSAPSCGDKIQNHLALPLLPPKTGPVSVSNPPIEDRTDGGMFGTRADLVQAINAAVKKATKGKPAPAIGKATLDPEDNKLDVGRLVINLSLGWDGQLKVLSEEKCEDCDEAVKFSLIRASCAGALLVAAAGNGRHGKGAIFPAAWEAERAPSEDDCTKLGFTWSPRPDKAAGSTEGPAYRPLVHAVAAVDVRDHPLLTTRPGSLPRLVAYGTGIAVREKNPPPKRTEFLTGTSMSAAAVSGVAALVWGMAPTLSAGEVMDLVYESAVSLKDNAQLCLSGRCSKIRRVSACAALNMVSSHVAGSASPSSGSGILTSTAAPANGSACTVPAYGGAMPPLPAPPPATPISPPPGGGSHARRLHVHMFPWVEPQPGPHGCDGCAVNNGFLEGGVPKTLQSNEFEVEYSWDNHNWFTPGRMRNLQNFSIFVGSGNVSGQPKPTQASIRFTLIANIEITYPEEVVPVKP